MQETSLVSLSKKIFSINQKQENFGEKFYDKIGQLKDFYLPICDLFKTYF